MLKKSFKKLDNYAFKIVQMSLLKKVIVLSGMYILVDNIMFFIGYICLYLQDIAPIATIIFIPLYLSIAYSSCTIFTNAIMVGWFKMRLIHVVIMFPIVYIMNVIRISIVFSSNLDLSEDLYDFLEFLPIMSMLSFVGYVIGLIVQFVRWCIERSNLIAQEETLTDKEESGESNAQNNDIEKSIEEKRKIIEKYQVEIDKIDNEINEYRILLGEQAQNKEEDLK